MGQLRHSDCAPLTSGLHRLADNLRPAEPVANLIAETRPPRAKYRPDVSATLTTVAFDQSGPRWLGINDLIAEPEGPTFSSYKVAGTRLNRLRFVTQDPLRMARSILERHSGRLECREPAPTSGLGF